MPQGDIRLWFRFGILLVCTQKNRISSATRQFCWLLCYTQLLGLVEKSFSYGFGRVEELECKVNLPHVKHPYLYLQILQWKPRKYFVHLKQSIHHPNVDCVHGHLEREIVLIQCVKRWPFINIHFSTPLYRNVVNVLVFVRRKSFLQYSDAVSGRNLTSESWGFVPSKPFQIASVDHLELSYLSPSMSTWKRPPKLNTLKPWLNL